MRYFHWKLDIEGAIEPENPLGDIKLPGDFGYIEEKDVMLDSFLEALQNGMALLVTKDSAIIDTIDEPHNLHFDRVVDGVKLSYGTQSLLIKDERLFRLELSTVMEDMNRMLIDLSDQ